MRLKDLIGIPFGRDYVVISHKKALHKKTGKVVPLENVINLEEENSIVEIKPDVEKIDGLSNVKIDLSLVSREQFPAKDGFLIEVYESGSDGKLTRVYHDDIIDPFTGDIVREGFSNYLILKVDVDE